MNSVPAPLGSLVPDLLCGAAEIAQFLFGDARRRRRVYYLVEKTRLPVFRLGAKICARPSVLMAWIAEQEKNGGWLSPRSSPEFRRDAHRPSGTGSSNSPPANVPSSFNARRADDTPLRPGASVENDAAASLRRIRAMLREHYGVSGPRPFGGGQEG